jgi:hypothetical protein
MAPPEIYVSTDIEADGPIPGPHSMLSFASVAYSLEHGEFGSFEANLALLPEASPDPVTMAWWSTEPDAWARSRTDLEEPRDAMMRYRGWLESLPGTPVFVAYPAGFDFTFIHWYLIRFTGRNPFSHSALDMKTLAMAMLGVPYRRAVKKVFPKRWKDTSLTHTHVALDDAREQGAIFMKMMSELVETRGKGL